MIKKFTFGTPICTEAVVGKFETSDKNEFPFKSREEDGKFVL